MRDEDVMMKFHIRDILEIPKPSLKALLNSSVLRLFLKALNSVIWANLGNLVKLSNYLSPFGMKIAKIFDMVTIITKR